MDSSGPAPRAGAPGSCAAGSCAAGSLTTASLGVWLLLAATVPPPARAEVARTGDAAVAQAPAEARPVPARAGLALEPEARARCLAFERALAEGKPVEVLPPEAP